MNISTTQPSSVMRARESQTASQSAFSLSNDTTSASVTAPFGLTANQNAVRLSCSGDSNTCTPSSVDRSVSRRSWA